MDRTVDLVASAVLASLGVSACGPSGGASTTTKREGAPILADSRYGGDRAGPTGYTKDDKGVVYRDGPASCSPSIEGSCSGVIDHRSCSDDPDCTAGAHGQCVGFDVHPSGGKTCSCVYSCASDADCKNGEACVCGEIEGGRSQCVKAECTSDADCKRGRCAVSTYNNGCYTDVRLACLDADAACRTDADCGPKQQCGYVQGRDGKFAWGCQEGGCVVGRPLVVDGRQRAAGVTVRTGWSADTPGRAGRFAGHERAEALARHWREVAVVEHASIASFARFTLELMSLGAPADLVLATQRALADEIEHARAAFAIASEYADEEVGPSPLPEAALPLDASVDAIVLGLVRDGCIGESMGAVEAELLAEVALSDRRAHLAKVADDELAHAVLAYRALRWMRTRFGVSVEAAAWSAYGRALVEAELVAAPSHAHQGLAAHGLLAPAEVAASRRRTLERVVGPSLRAALAPSGLS